MDSDVDTFDIWGIEILLGHFKMAQRLVPIKGIKGIKRIKI
jgi:hypothetical protein